MRHVQQWPEKVHLKIEYFSEILGKFADTKFRWNLPKMVCFEFFWCNVPFFAENSEILLRNMYLDIKNFGHLKLAKFRRFRRKMVPIHHWSSKTTQFWVFDLLFPCTKNKSFSEISENKWYILAIQLKAWKIAIQIAVYLGQHRGV